MLNDRTRTSYAATVLVIPPQTFSWRPCARAFGIIATLFRFGAEWGLKDVPGDGPRTEKISREMARAAEVSVAVIGRAWDLALTERPDLELHDADGNHESSLGAFLTACVLVGQIIGESPAPLAAFAYLRTDDAVRKFLADAATRAIAQDAAGDRHE